MKKTLLTVLIFMFALMINQTVNAASVTDSKKDAGYISLNGSETKEVEPNIARIVFAVENTAQDAKTASLENNKISNTIIEALKLKINSQTDKIKTTNFSIRPNYSNNGGKRTIKNYMAVNSVTVETKDIKKVSDLIDTAIANGANRINGLTYSYDQEKQVCAQIYPEIVKDLKSQASVLAQATGTSIDGLKHMNASCNIDSVISNGRFYAKGLAMEAEMDAAAPATPVEAGKVRIHVYVNADFYVK